MTKEEFSSLRNSVLDMMKQTLGICTSIDDGKYYPEDGGELYFSIYWTEHKLSNNPNRKYDSRDIAHVEFDESMDSSDAKRQIKEAWEALQKEL